MNLAAFLSERVDIQEPTESQGATGEVTSTWSTLYSSVPAQVTFLRGTELLDRTSINSMLNWRIRMRYRSGITPKMRAVWKSKIFDIEAVDDSRRREGELRLYCVERQA